MQHKKTWMLIADASKARIYSFYKARLLQDPQPKNLDLITELTHEKSRMKGIDLETDKMGSYGFGKYEEATPPKLQEAETFAAQLAHHLEHGRKEDSYTDIILIAPPTFMGLLQKHLTAETHKLINKTIEKDYTYQTDQEFLKNLLHYF